jgi:small-conductance mechanosensitive channel
MGVVLAAVVVLLSGVSAIAQTPPRPPSAASAPVPPPPPPPAAQHPAAPAPAPASAPAAHPPASPAPAASADKGAHGAAEPASKTASVRIHDRKVFDVLVPRGGRSADQRAAEATKVLERLVEEAEVPEVRVQVENDTAVVFGGKSPIIQLGPDDAAAAGDASLGVHAEAVAGKVKVALRAERQRSAIATTVFAFSLLVFSALMALLLVRKVGELLERLRAWVDENPGRLPALHVRGIEVVQPAAVRGGIGVALGGATLVARIGILYAWVLIALSLFESTRGYSERLTGFVLSPVSALMGRVALALPLLVIAFVTVLAVGVSLRFVRLFFGSIARGETTVSWMPRDLAEPTSILFRAGIVVVTLVVAAPLITGTDDGTLSRAGVVALVAIGLAATPLLACMAAGIAVVFGRRLRIGDLAAVGGREGRVRGLSMLEVLLEDEDGCAVHVPHLVSLWLPTRVIGTSAHLSADLSVDPKSDLSAVVELLKKTAGTVGGRPRVEVLGLDADGAHLRVAVVPRGGSDRNSLYVALSSALRGDGIELGKRRRTERAA